MNILFLTDNFPPEVNAPASRTFEHCREWARGGHEVTVITCAPNFPKGRVFDGYRNCLWQVEFMQGIRVVRVWSYVAANQGRIRRSLDYLSFMITSTIAGMFTRRPDVVVGTSPQFFVTCAAYVLSLLRRRPFVFELRDLWPDSIRAVGALRPGRMMSWFERVELFLYRKAALVVALTDSFKANLVRRGVPQEKIRVVTNGVDRSRFSPRPKDRDLNRALGLEGKFVVGYVGTHGMAHGLETILDAAELIQCDAGRERQMILMLGDGARKRGLQQDAERRKLRNVLFLDSVSKDEVVRYWSLLDVAVIHLSQNPVFETVIPSKLFESMGMGVPVLLGVAGESARIVEQQGVGRCFAPGNASELANAIVELSGSPGAMAQYRRACMDAAPRFDRRRLAGSMLESLEALGGAPPDRSR